MSATGVLFIVASGWVGVASADVGTTTAIHNYEPDYDDPTAINVSIAEADGDLWYAVEVLEDQTVSPMVHLVDLFHDDGSIDQRTLADNLVSDTAAVYPSVMTYDGAQYVYVAGKQNQTTTAQQIEVYKIDRDTIPVASISTGTLGTGDASSTQHGLTQFVWDYETATANICYTRTIGGDDDAFSKAREHNETWASQPLQEIKQNAGTVEDHCHSAFTPLGERFTVYHSDRFGSNSIHLKVDQFNPTTDSWTNFSGFNLINPANQTTNWPDIHSIKIAGLTYMTVVAQNGSNSLLAWWQCFADRPDCDGASGDWGNGATVDLAGTQVIQPEVIGQNTGGDLDWVVAYESQGRIRLATRCDSAATWSNLDLLALHTDYNSSPDCRFSVLSGSSTRQVAIDYDTDELHVVYVCQLDSDSTVYNPIHTVVDWSDVCP